MDQGDVDARGRDEALAAWLSEDPVGAAFEVVRSLDPEIGDDILARGWRAAAARWGQGAPDVDTRAVADWLTGPGLRRHAAVVAALTAPLLVGEQRLRLWQAAAADAADPVSPWSQPQWILANGPPPTNEAELLAVLTVPQQWDVDRFRWAVARYEHPVQGEDVVSLLPTVPEPLTERLAGDCRLSEPVARVLSRHPSPAVRSALATNGTVPDDVVATLLVDPAQSVAMAAARRASPAVVTAYVNLFDLSSATAASQPVTPPPDSIFVHGPDRVVFNSRACAAAVVRLGGRVDPGTLRTVLPHLPSDDYALAAMIQHPGLDPDTIRATWARVSNRARVARDIVWCATAPVDVRADGVAHLDRWWLRDVATSAGSQGDCPADLLVALDERLASHYLDLTERLYGHANMPSTHLEQVGAGTTKRAALARAALAARNPQPVTPTAEQAPEPAPAEPPDWMAPLLRRDAEPAAVGHVLAERHQAGLAAGECLADVLSETRVPLGLRRVAARLAVTLMTHDPQAARTFPSHGLSGMSRFRDALPLDDATLTVLSERDDPAAQRLVSRTVTTVALL